MKSSPTDTDYCLPGGLTGWAMENDGLESRQPIQLHDKSAAGISFTAHTPSAGLHLAAGIPLDTVLSFFYLA